MIGLKPLSAHNESRARLWIGDVDRPILMDFCYNKWTLLPGPQLPCEVFEPRVIQQDLPSFLQIFLNDLAIMILLCTDLLQELVVISLMAQLFQFTEL